MDAVNRAGIEILDLELSHIHSWMRREHIRIGVLEEDAGGPDGTISLVIAQFYKPGGEYKMLEVLQANLTESEIDQVIVGLQEAKRQMAIYGGVTPT